MMYLGIYFYIPKRFWPKDIPESPSSNWAGFGLGIYAWTVQTYLRLRDAGLSCALVDQLPQEGIVFLHRHLFRCHPEGIKASPRRLLVCLQADCISHRDAQVHVVQNLTQENPRSRNFFVPHWPQPGLLARDEERGNRFQTVAFFGHSASLAPELSGAKWQERLHHLGLTWRPVINNHQWYDYQTLDNRWNDYRNVDVIVAVRSFDKTDRVTTRGYRHKPASKLYNAWLTGVPAILGAESGYQSERQTSLDYIEASSLSDVLQALTRLREDLPLRQAMVRNGRIRSQSISPETLTHRWLHLIQHTLLPLYESWCTQSQWQQQLAMQHMRLQQRLHRRMHSWRYILSQG